MKRYLLISKLDNGYSQILLEDDSLSKIIFAYQQWNKILPLNCSLDIYMNYYSK